MFLSLSAEKTADDCVFTDASLLMRGKRHDLFAAKRSIKRPDRRRDNFMTFSCKNFDFNTENCMKLNSDCIPGRPGCVLEGKVRFSEDIHKKLKALEEQKMVRRTKRNRE